MLEALLLVGLLFAHPILAVGIGWFAGSVVELLFGTYITSGLNLLFNTVRFEPNHIPVLCSILAVVGSFFKSVQTNKSA